MPTEQGFWAVGLLAALLLPVTAAAVQPEPAYAQQDGATYYMAYGVFGKGTLALGPAYDGQPTLPFEGCAFAQLRPGLDHGRVRLLGLVNGEAQTLLDLDLDSFSAADPAMQGGIATNLTTDGSLGSGSPQHPAVFAEAAAWGQAALTVNRRNLTDPGGGGELLDASLLVARDGFRDEASKGIPLADGQGWFDPASPRPARIQEGSPELHLRIRSPPGASPTPQTLTFASPPSQVPGGDTPLEGAYLQRERFDNTRFGGHARIHIAASAKAPAGHNQLTFTFFSPSGDELGNRTLAPALLSDQGADLDFPLTQFGVYGLKVEGRLLLGQYQVTVVLDPPPSLDLNLWWDEVRFGRQARAGYSACQAAVEQGGATVPTSVFRPEPPQFPLQLAAIAAVGVLAGVLLAVKLVSTTRAAAGFSRTWRK